MYSVRISAYCTTLCLPNRKASGHLQFPRNFNLVRFDCWLNETSSYPTAMWRLSNKNHATQKQITFSSPPNTPLKDPHRDTLRRGSSNHWLSCCFSEFKLYWLLQVLRYSRQFIDISFSMRKGKQSPLSHDTKILAFVEATALRLVKPVFIGRYEFIYSRYWVILHLSRWGEPFAYVHTIGILEDYWFSSLRAHISAYLWSYTIL